MKVSIIKRIFSPLDPSAHPICLSLSPLNCPHVCACTVHLPVLTPYLSRPSCLSLPSCLSRLFHLSHLPHFILFCFIFSFIHHFFSVSIFPPLKASPHDSHICVLTHRFNRLDDALWLINEPDVRKRRIMYTGLSVLAWAFLPSDFVLSLSAATQLKIFKGYHVLVKLGSSTTCLQYFFL